MVKIVVEEDCGNAPKKLFVKDFNIACVQGDIEGALQMITDEAVWKIIGGDTHTGRTEIEEYLKSFAGLNVLELRLDNVISHGDRCAANGILISESRKLAFCNVYRFSSHAKDAKIKHIASYELEIE